VGPILSVNPEDAWLIEANDAMMTEVALLLYRAGHLPVMAEWLAFALSVHAGSGMGDPIFDEIFHNIAHRIVEKCDACLRMGGESEGADELLAIARALDKKIYYSLEEILPARR
jgi:hypothetical protein